MKRIRYVIGLILTGLSLSGVAIYGEEEQLPQAFNSPELQHFIQMLGELDLERPESLSIGVDRYKKAMSKATHSICDSAYVILEDFALYATDAADFNLILLRNPGNKVAPGNQASSGNKAGSGTNKKGSRYEQLLMKNYFIVSHQNDQIIITPDLGRIQKELKEYLSPDTYAYFMEVDRENLRDNGQIESHSPQEIAQRLCFWEKFLSKSSDFLYRPEAEQRRDLYLERLIFGSDQQPVYDKEGKVRTSYLQAFRYVTAQKNTAAEPEGKTYRVMEDFLKVLEQSGFKEGPLTWGFTF